MSEITNFKGETTPHAPTPEEMVDQLVGRVGERVRKARERRGMARRILSEKSGVSPRYLAQLEAGDSNISIALLLRIALVLDYPIEWLVGEEDPWTSETLRFADLFRTSTTDTRRDIMARLAPAAPENLRARRLCLIGLRGAGKSTLGAMAGHALKIPFVELNREIEEQAGMPIVEIMALYGQEGYRMLETQAVGRIVATYDSMILAVAGGIVSEPDTYRTLLAHFHTIWVRATASEHMLRVRAQGDLRPMAGNPEAMQQLTEILASREPLYARAAARLDTSGKTPQKSLKELLELIHAGRFLNLPD